MNLNLNNVTLDKTSGKPEQLLKKGLPQIAFSGRSNVGKSSLVNSLLKRKALARVSSEPGKTITVNYYLIDKTIYFVDMPGYGYAKRAKEDIKVWSALTQSFFDDNETLRVVLQLVDIRHNLSADDRSMLEWLNYYEIPYVLVATKCDKLGKTALTEQAKALINDRSVRPGTECVLYSSHTGEGRDALWDRISAYYE